MKVVFLLALVGVALAFDFPEEWEVWKQEHNKKYGSEEEELHRHITWQSNKKYIDGHNEHSDAFGFTLKMNEFGDMDGAEFAKMYNGYRMQPDRQPGKMFNPPPLTDLPTTVDWRPKGYVTAIKNQGQCGSCWAFSATGSLEGQHFNATGKLVSLSEQNLVDCSGAEGNMGCNGGLMDSAFKYIIKNNGIDTEASYPYVARNENCRFNAANVGATESSYVDIPSKSESALQAASATIGPISVAMDASHLSFQFYHSGVYTSLFCSQTKLDHGVLVVGYGVSGSKDYWLVKNSWGTSWGMDGYFMLARNHDNECGVATQASYPVV